jgi:cytochrome c
MFLKALARMNALSLLAVIASFAATIVPLRAFAQTTRNNPPTYAVSASDAGSGKALFNQHCASCHFAETTAQKIGPGLKGLYRRATFSDGKKVTDASLTKWIEVGGKNMPGFKDDIKTEQIRELIIYIRTL